MSPGSAPGLRLAYFPRDWRGFSSLAFACHNPSSRPLKLTVRIDDRLHDETYEDRFNLDLELAPGETRVQIPLADVARAPRGRSMDLENVRSVVVFRYRLEEPRELFLTDFRLVP